MSPASINAVRCRVVQSPTTGHFAPQFSTDGLNWIALDVAYALQIDAESICRRFLNRCEQTPIAGETVWQSSAPDARWETRAMDRTEQDIFDLQEELDEFVKVGERLVYGHKNFIGGTAWLDLFDKLESLIAAREAKEKSA